MENIGFIGLGAMGNPMALNLALAGYKVYAYDVSKDAVNRLAKESNNVMSCSSLAEVAKNSEMILSSLPNDAIVTETMSGIDGVINNCSKGTIIVDLSSVSSKTSQDMYKIAKEKGVDYMDAPVSGGVAGAKKGTLTLMVGGDKEVFDKAVEVLNCIGKNINYIGEIGLGDAIKIVNNLILGCNMATLSQALLLGRKLGLSYETMNSIIGSSSGNSYVFNAKMENFIIPDKFDGGFAIALQKKDMGLALASAEDVGVNLSMGKEAIGLFEEAMKMGYEKNDISALTKAVSKMPQDIH